MWLVSDECTRVGRETKRLWNSCQARVLQNGLLTAFSIPLHHSSWTLPLISSPALPIPFLCLLCSPPPALFVAEEDAQSVGGILQTTQPLQPGWTGPLPGSFSRDGPENQRHTGICAHTCKTGPGETSQSVTTHFNGKKKNIPLFNFYLPGGGIPLHGGIFSSYHNNSVLCLALSEPHPASRLPCAACAK